MLRREGSLQAYAEVLISDFHRVGDSRCVWTLPHAKPITGDLVTLKNTVHVGARAPIKVPGGGLLHPSPSPQHLTLLPCPNQRPPCLLALPPASLQHLQRLLLRFWGGGVLAAEQGD